MRGGMVPRNRLSGGRGTCHPRGQVSYAPSPDNLGVSGRSLYEASPLRGHFHSRPGQQELRMTEVYAKLQAMWATRERGATAVEYGLMVALIAVVVIGAVTLLGTNLNDKFQ